MQISILGVDNGKNSFSVVGDDDQRAVILRRTIRRQTLTDFVEKLPGCVIAIGLIERDGLVVLFGLSMTLIALAVTGALLYTAAGIVPWI